MSTTPNAPKKVRVNRTLAEKAQDRLDAAKARVHRANDAVKRTTQAANEAAGARNVALDEQKAAQAAVDFERRNPDLPKNVTSPVVNS